MQVHAVAVFADGSTASAPSDYLVTLLAPPTAVQVVQIITSTCQTVLNVTDSNALVDQYSVVAVPHAIWLAGAANVTKTWTLDAVNAHNLTIPLIPGNYTLYVTSKWGKLASTPFTLEVAVPTCPDDLPGVTCNAGAYVQYWMTQFVPNSLSIFPDQDSVPPTAICSSSKVTDLCGINFSGLNAAILFRGSVYIPEDGEYNFVFYHDDGGRLYVDDVVPGNPTNNCGAAATGLCSDLWAVNNNVYVYGHFLTKGRHSLRFEGLAAMGPVNFWLGMVPNIPLNNNPYTSGGLIFDAPMPEIDWLPACPVSLPPGTAAPRPPPNPPPAPLPPAPYIGAEVCPVVGGKCTLTLSLYSTAPGESCGAFARACVYSFFVQKYASERRRTASARNCANPSLLQSRPGRGGSRSAPQTKRFTMSMRLR